MKAILITLLFTFALSSFATQGQDSDELVQTTENTAYADSTLENNPPEGIEETEPHFVINGRKFWIIIDNKRSPETYDEKSEIYQYFSQVPESLFNFKEGISHATFIYKEQENTQAMVEVGK